MPNETSPLASILQHLRSEPSRTGSIVITVFGDAVLPRGGSLWLGSLLLLFEAMEIGAGVVRTAMSRLTVDDWLERTRVGRNSFYTLTQKGQASFAEAAQRIYGAPPALWDGQLEIVLPGNGGDRQDTRDALQRAGFGGLLDGMWIAPGGTPLPPRAVEGIRIQGCTDLETGRRLAEQAWPLERTAQAYRQFTNAFNPLRAWLAEGARLSGLDAMMARTLLIHEYRRVVLRDPLLPRPLLPDRWPGTEARQVCAEIYAALLVESEHWLDENGRDENGVLPPPSIDLSDRFVGVSRECVTVLS